MSIFHFQVDVRGRCGEPLYDGEPNFPDSLAGFDSLEYYNSRNKQLIEEYFFFLSFENSNCKDYISEKFFSAIFAKTIPVVFGAPKQGNNHVFFGFPDITKINGSWPFRE